MGTVRDGPATRRQGWAPVVAAICAIVALAAGALFLATRDQWRATGVGSSSQPSGSPPPVVVTGMISCFGRPPGFSPAALASAGDAEMASTPQAEALRSLISESHLVPTSGWKLVSDSPSAVTYLATTTESLGYGGTHAEVTLSLESGKWTPQHWGNCILQALPPDGYGVATWSLDPSVAFTPATTDLHILVTEWSCHGFATADGRIMASIAAQASSMTVNVYVRSLQGPQACPGTPPTPYVVHLDQEAGSRTILDGGSWPAQVRAANGKPTNTDSPVP